MFTCLVPIAAKENFISKLLKWYHTQIVSPNYTALSESGKSKATGDVKELRTKKQSEQIKSIIQHIEVSNMEWQRRGEEPVPELEQGKSTSFDLHPSYMIPDFPLHMLVVAYFQHMDLQSITSGVLWFQPPLY